METQVERELKQRETAASRILDHLEDLAESGHGNLRPAAQQLVRAGIPKLAAEVRRWQETEKGRPHRAGRRTAASRLISDVKPELLAYLTLATLFAKALRPKATKFVSMAHGLGKAVEEELRWASLRRTHPHSWARLDKQGRLTGQARVRAMALKAVAEYHSVPWETWPKEDRVNVGATLYDMVERVLGLVELVNIDTRIHPAMRLKTQKVYKLTDRTLRWIEGRDLAMAFAGVGLYPMCEAPIPWSTPTDGGYLTMQMDLIKARNSTWLEEQHDRDLQVVYDAVNAVQNTAWAINEDVMVTLEEAWKQDWQVKGVPELDEVPLPPQPEGAEKGSPAWNEWRVLRAKTERWNYQQTSRRVSVVGTLACARTLIDDPCIYFPHQLDWRGRMYSAPIGLSPQGQDFQKGMLQFAEAKPLTDDEQWAWLKRHGANMWGHDKLPFEEREEWVDSVPGLLESVAADPLSNREWMEADKPFGFLAFCVDYRRALDTGSSSLPVAMDGSCSGLQHFSAMLRDARGAQAVNLIPSDRPMDIYSEVAGRLSELVEARAGEELADAWLESGMLDRTLCKRPTMTTPYGVTSHGVLLQTAELLQKELIDTGKRPVDDGTDAMAGASSYIAPLIQQAISGVVPKAMQAMDTIRKLVYLLGAEGLQAEWTIPSTNFNVRQNYLPTRSRRVQTIMHGKSYRYRLLTDDPNGGVNRSKARAGSAPNLIHSLDAAHLMMTVNAMECESDTPVSYAMVHDSFACHAADAPLMARVLREQFVELYEDPHLFHHLLRQMIELLPEDKRPSLWELGTPPVGSFDLERVMDADYFFA